MILNGKVVLITGGYGYLGQGIVKGLLSQGAVVVVLARDVQKFESLKTQVVVSAQLDLHFEYCDISSSVSFKTAFMHCQEKFGRINAVINNAFFSKGQNPEVLTDEDWTYGLSGTLSSVFKSIREIIPLMKEKGGSIINVSSMYGIVAPDFEAYRNAPDSLNPPHYGAAKAGILQLTRYYASYLGKYNIRVNAVTPGPFPSPEVQKDKAFVEELKKRTLLGRIGVPEDLTGVFVLLVSDYSGFITGQNFIVDGGWTAK